MKKWFKKLFLWLVGLFKRKPERFPESENTENFREANRQIEERGKAAILSEHNNCDHIAGCSRLSDLRDLQGRTSIVWHQLSFRVTFGICLVCQRQFWPTDPDYDFWKRQRSFSKSSSEGSRWFADPQATVQKFLKEEVRPFELDPNPRKLPRFTAMDWDDHYKSRAYPATDLDALSDSEIERLWKEVMEFRKTGQEPIPPPLSRLRLDPDPWFLNRDGSPDLFAEANVDLQLKDTEDRT
jgi:hypothetical protein